MKLKKSIINQILNSYSIRSNEFEALEVKGKYKSIYTKGYCITIELEIVGNKETGRILVYHTNSKGKRTFIDIWDIDNTGKYYWKYRNPVEVPLSDAEAIKELERELSEVKLAAQKIKEKCLKNINETKKRAGRPKETEKLKEKSERIRQLKKEGKSNFEIMDIMQISRATLYRLRKEV